MALYYDLPVYNDVYSLVLMIYRYTKEFPREYKYSLGEDMKHDALKLVRSIYRANKAKVKESYLEEFLDDFEILKFELRLSRDLGILTIRHQAEMSELIASIGKQVTGWRNSSVRKERNLPYGG